MHDGNYDMAKGVSENGSAKDYNSHHASVTETPALTDALQEL